MAHSYILHIFLTSHWSCTFFAKKFVWLCKGKLARRQWLYLVLIHAVCAASLDQLQQPAAAAVLLVSCLVMCRCNPVTLHAVLLFVNRRRQMLLSTVDPELERSLETVAAKATAKVRAKSSAGKVCITTIVIYILHLLLLPALIPHLACTQASMYVGWQRTCKETRYAVGGCHTRGHVLCTCCY